MSIIKGDLSKMIGLKTVSIKGEDGLEEFAIDLSQTTFKDITTFTTIPTRALGGKKFDQLTAEDMEKLNTLQMEWYIDYFKDKCPEQKIEDIKLFVALNRNKLYNEFAIAFNLKTRTQIEEETKKFTEEIKKNL